jgi:uncharacterized repeat protein (TIGR01451 family)
MTARFGYVNASGGTQTVAFGPENRFSPDPFFRPGQPITFRIGIHRGAFETSFDESGSRMTWSIFHVLATADLDEGPYCDAPVPEADLRVSQTVSEPAVAGEDLTYTLTATNGGPDEASDVLLTDALPGDVDLVSVNASKGTCAEGETVVCDIGSLAGDESATVEIKVKPERHGTLVNTATVFSTQTRDPETSNNLSIERTTAVAPPSTMTGAASGITRNGATVRAFVDPGGVETTYRFEYGESASHGNTTPEQTLAAGFGPVSVEAAIEGLKPGKRYHYRIVATNRHRHRRGRDVHELPARNHPAHTRRGSHLDKARAGDQPHGQARRSGREGREPAGRPLPAGRRDEPVPAGAGDEDWTGRRIRLPGPQAEPDDLLPGPFRRERRGRAQSVEKPGPAGGRPALGAATP